VGLSDQLKSSSARTPALILAVLILLGLGLAAVAAIQGNGPDPASSQVVRASPRDSTTTSSTVDPAAAASSTTSTTAPEAAVPTVTRAPSVGGPGPTPAPTTVGPPPVVTTAAPPTVPSTPQCSPDQADQTLSTDKPSYNAGEIVIVTASVRNHSTTTCAVADPDTGCYTLLSALLAGVSDPLWRSGAVPSGPCSPPPRRTLFPGAVANYTASWDQSDRRGCRPDGSDPGCGKSRVPGLYSIQSIWLGAPKGAPFQLV
jgi:hypothetical protein